MPHTAENPAAGHVPRTGGVTRCHVLRIFGLPEPQVRELLADLLCDTGTLSLTPCALTGEVSLRLSALLLGVACLSLFYIRRYKHTKKDSALYKIITVLLTVCGVVYTFMGVMGLLTLTGIL